MSFITSLDGKTHARVAAAIDLLERGGSQLSMPHSRKMSRNLYELRVRGQIEVRVFYTIQANAIYLLHAYQKKSQKTPSKELSTALARLTRMTYM